MHKFTTEAAQAIHRAIQVGLVQAIKLFKHKCMIFSPPQNIGVDLGGKGKPKMKLLSTLVVIALCSLAGMAQETPFEPEFADVFFRLDAGKLVPLERQTAAIQGKASGFIVMSMKASWEIPGTKSPIRFRSDQSLDFVVRSQLVQSAVDPSTFYFLRKLNIKKKTRELVVMVGHASPGGATMNNDPAQGALPVTFTRYGTLSLKMTTGPLQSGEYALSGPYAQTVFCFGVD